MSLCAPAVSNAIFLGIVVLCPLFPDEALAAYRGTLTQGSVIFTGANGGDAQDNSNFFWDATNHQLGIGTTSPTAPLTFASAHGLKINLYQAYAQGFGTAANLLFAGLNSSSDRFGVGIYDGSSSLSSELLTVKGNGNVGIGTTTPVSSNGIQGTILDVNSAGSANSIAVLGSGATSGSSAGGVFEVRSNLAVTGDARLGQVGWTRGTDVTSGKLSSAADLYVNNDGTLVDAVHISSSGNVGIGTTGPKLVLDAAGTSGPPATSGTSPTGFVRFESNAAYGNVLDIGGNTASPYGVWLQAYERTNLAGSYPLILQPNGGNVGIGTNVPGYPLHVYTSTAAAIVIKLQNGTGYCTMTPTTTTWACTSDARMKKDIVDAGPALPWLSDMRVRDFTMKSDNSRLTGVIAQEMLPIHPDMVHLGKDDGIYTVDAPNPWKLVKAIQELKADNDNLRQEVEKLKAEVRRRQ
ncbi:MAG: tail fiber domain-containing protein [Devosia sp.]|nr:tail fiber domain-containing protein [Devosia sp.]